MNYRIKDEKNFAKTITTRYKMSNTKNKDFVNIVLLLADEIKKFFNIEKLSNELELLGFHFIKFEDSLKYIGVVKNNESRLLCYNKVLSINVYM